MGTHRELLNIQTGVDGDQNKGNSTELLLRENLEGTPFMIVGSKERGYFLAFGKFRITEPKPTKEEVKDDLEKDKWKILVDVMVSIVTIMNDKKVQTVNDSFKDKDLV